MVINPGEPFNEQKMSAIEQVKSNLAKNAVVEVKKSGYVMHDKVIRHAAVSVSDGSLAPANANTQQQVQNKTQQVKLQQQINQNQQQMSMQNKTQQINQQHHQQHIQHQQQKQINQNQQQVQNKTQQINHQNNK